MTSSSLNLECTAAHDLRLKHDFSTRLRSHAIPKEDSDPQIRELYRPFILDEKMDWISNLEPEGAMDMAKHNLL
jgi:hypothetical protein